MTDMVTASNFFLMDGKVVKEVSKKMKVKNLIVSAQVLSFKCYLLSAFDCRERKRCSLWNCFILSN